MEETILRKLTPSEDCLTYFIENGGNWLYPTTIIIQSEIDLFLHKNKLQDSISIWKNLHPLLNCHLRKTQDGHNFVKSSLQDDYNNIHFIKLSKSISREDDWKLIHKHEFINPFGDNDLLWRLLVLELINDPLENVYKYAFIINLHHAISDGSNNIAIIKELLNLIENSLTQNANEISNERLEHSKYEFKFENDPRIGQKSEHLHLNKNDEFVPIGVPLIFPEYLKNNSPRKYLSDQDGEYVNLNGEIYSSIKELNDKVSQSRTGYITKKIQSEIFEKFVQKCKEKGVKLNSVFEVISSIAYKKLNEKYAERKCDDMKVNYLITINIRQFLNIPNYVMGFWIDSFRNQINLNFNDKTESFWQSEFWDLCHEQCKKLHDYINERGFLRPEKQIEMANCAYMLENRFRLNDLMVHYSLSNLGDQTIKENGKLFDIKEYYFGLSFEKMDYKYGLLSTCSINNESFWSFSFTRDLISDQAAQDFLDFIQDFIEKCV
ncbi:unnamed protein product [Brachionus calyciflorus]|uniref:Condensation domain-containing protein n=1 Tax=Brachionus calyciflorus TaxID=104777 RepID=A0A814LC25_9BILA|nr:unnamed protein product [Brachionus calyciflorus]